MDYLKIYNSIIERARFREIIGYKEKHHIIPRCMGGTDSNENMVDLTPKEHFLCHLLLCEIYPNHEGLKYAAFSMCKWSGGTVRRKRISGITYDRLKKEAAKITSERMKGNSIWKNKKHSDESIEKIKNQRKLQKTSDETRKKMSDSRKGKKSGRFGKTNTEDHNRKVSESLKKNKNRKKWNERKCSIKGIVYKSASEASRLVNESVCTIMYRLKSKNIKYKEYFYV